MGPAAASDDDDLAAPDPRGLDSSHEGVSKPPALHVIVLGSGGGPQEHNTTAFLVRSVAAGWTKGSVIALDAGVHLGAITRILESTQPRLLGTDGGPSLPHTLTDGPFAGLEVPHTSPSANAAHITRSLIDTYLITHPHLDHISAFVINTAGFNGTRPKRLAGLPSTIAAFKTHIFNNVIWPNLSDENNGVGLVTYTRLVEGGSPAVGEGEGKGYLEIAEGLSAKVYAVSHGHCIERHSHRGSHSNAGTPVRYGSMDASSLASPRNLPSHPGPGGVPSPYTSQSTHSQGSPAMAMGPQQLQQQQQQQQQPPQAASLSRVQSMASHAATLAAASPVGAGLGGELRESFCVYDSSAYFIRDMATGREVLMFGDVEPDQISLSPRNLHIWQETAPKIAAGNLSGIFIECSYDDSQGDDRLFGHLKPVYVIDELRALAAEVEIAKSMLASKKRKRGDSDAHVLFAAARNRRAAAGAVGASGSGLPTSRAVSDGAFGYATTSGPGSGPGPLDDPISPKTTRPQAPSGQQDDESITDSPQLSSPTAGLALRDVDMRGSLGDGPVTQGATATTTGNGISDPPLKGVKVVIIHVKDKLLDGYDEGARILAELQAHDLGHLGCEFIIAEVGQSLYL